MFSNRLENFLLFSSNSKLSSADCFNLDLSKILSSGNGLINVCSVKDICCKYMVMRFDTMKKEKKCKMESL